MQSKAFVIPISIEDDCSSLFGHFFSPPANPIGLSTVYLTTNYAGTEVSILVIDIRLP
jgi:hypothetical protein